MLFYGLLLTFFLGICILLSISQRLKLVELLGLAFPIGIASQTVLMVFLDLLHVKLTSTALAFSSFLLILGLLIYLFFQRKNLKEWTMYVSKFTFPKLNLLWGLAIVAITALVVMNVGKTMFFPTFDTDSVRVFNLQGMAIAHEGAISNLSLYRDVNYNDGNLAASVTAAYTPLTTLSYAYVYIFGAEISKIVNALFFISFVLTFYGILSRFTTHTLTAIVTFLAFLTPEMLAFSSLSGTNIIHAFYGSLGLLFLIAFYYKKENSFLWLSTLLLMFNVWARNEGLAFVGAAGCFLLWYCIKNKKYMTLISYGVIAMSAFIFWTFFLKINHLESTQVFIFKPFWDAEKASTIFTEAKILFESSTYYGISFSLFLIVFLSNVWNIYKYKDQGATLILIGSVIFIYYLLIYQIDYIWDSILNVLRYSAKRFTFSFIPLVWFYIGANRNVKWIFDKIDSLLFK